jgi:predicted nucleic acid-binding protein
MTLGELLTRPYATGDTAAIDYINGFFDETDFIRLVAHNKDDFVLSAQLRGTSKLKAIDALHVANAINHQCAFFITADKDLAKRAQGIEVVNLNDFL